MSEENFMISNTHGRISLLSITTNFRSSLVGKAATMYLLEVAKAIEINFLTQAKDKDVWAR